MLILKDLSFSCIPLESNLQCKQEHTNLSYGHPTEEVCFIFL